MDLPLTFTEAMRGAKVNVPTVDGDVTLSIPPGTSSGARLRIRGRGIEQKNGPGGTNFAESW